MTKGFAKDKFNSSDKKTNIKAKKLGSERMFSWSPWPSANFQTKYPAFPLIMTIFLLLIGTWYISFSN